MAGGSSSGTILAWKEGLKLLPSLYRLFKILGFNLYMRYIFRVLLMVLLNEMIRFMRWISIIL
ncbi:hypothetical protein M798_02060 [Brucella melitensis ADMAS-G1]|nr:hypothetical protein M798_02060 [Brucella melitensis ADMAS-G1]